jgi:phosphoserine phosphatase RsbU/P
MCVSHVSQEPDANVSPKQNTNEDYDVEDYRKKVENLEKLVEITSYLNSTIVLEDLLSRIMSASKRVVNADASSLYLLDEGTQTLVPIIIEGGAGGKLKTLPPLQLGQGIAGWVAEQGRSELIEDAYQHPKFDDQYDKNTGYHTKSMICVPIKSSSKILGVSQAINKKDGQPFNSGDLELFEAFCIQAAIAIENARMQEQLIARQTLEHDLQFAQTVQQSFLPQVVPDVPGFTFAAEYTAAQEVGGDFYDFIEFPDNRLGIVIGDVAGKGVAAALYMAKLMSDFRFIALTEHIPTRVLTRVNNLLVQRSRRGIFVTLVYVLIELRDNFMTIINAGHLPPLFREGKTGEVQMLDNQTAPPLGIMPDMLYQATCREFHAGDIVLLYTDGIMEARNNEKQEFGLDRLQSLLRAGSSDAELMVQKVRRELDTFTNGQKQHDDLTCVCFGAMNE